MREFAERFESHEFVIRLWRPGVNLYGIFQRDHEKLYPLVFHDFEMHGALQIAHVNPTITSLDLLQINK